MERRERLGLLLKERRLAAGLPIADVARKIRRSASFVRAYESGRVSVTVDEIEEISRAVGFPLTPLLSEYERL